MTSFPQRVLGVMRLDTATFKEIEADVSALPQAVLVVIASSVSAGIGLAPSLTLPTILVTIAWSLVGWLAWASLVNYLGGGLFPDAPTRVDLGATGADHRVQRRARGLSLERGPSVAALMGLRGHHGLDAGVDGGGRTQALDFQSVWRALAVCLGGAVLVLMAAIAIGVVWGPVCVRFLRFGGA